MIYIYGLFDPRNLSLRYIGKTDNLEYRLSNHISGARLRINSNPHRERWIRQLIADGLEPAIEVLEECTQDNWRETEQAWIREAREKGAKLTNIAKGGDGFESGESHLFFGLRGEKSYNYGKKASDITKLRMSQIRKGRPSPNVGREWSQEYKDKMSRALSGQNNPMYGLKGENHPATGYKHTDEVRARMMGNKHLLGHIPSEETRRKISEAGKGRKQTEADKTKKSLSQRMYHATKKELTEIVLSLQKNYLDLFGEYHSKYPHP